jgi:hypothetical protein
MNSLKRVGAEAEEEVVEAGEGEARPEAAR